MKNIQYTMKLIEEWIEPRGITVEDVGAINSYN
jgi:hypothetical protein